MAENAANQELAKSYSPAQSEGEIRAKWERSRAFHADVIRREDATARNEGATARPYCILIPPPNVTAALHLGHAFNNTIQDILIRYHRMRGFNTLWMPGTDHAGIATQTVVEKRLMQSEGKKRTDYSREEFIERVQAWKDEYEATIIEQLKAMGASCDFERTRFTMDEVCAKAVREAFFQLFKDGLIYRGKRLVNWDPVTQTALADDEVEMEEVAGKMYYLRYPVVEETSKSRKVETSKEYVVVATTRPETMLGDTAVAINPRDPRAAELRGKFVKLPIVGRIIPIVEDDYVVMPVEFGGDEKDAKAQFATGFLKVTPAHDPNDWEIGQRHNLPVINVMAPDASISDAHGWLPEDVSDEARSFVGLTREEARKKVIEWFKANGLYEGDREYTHSVGHSYRSHVPIEPYLSDQWYVRVTDDRMKGEALRAMAQDQCADPPPERQHIAPGLPGVGAASPELSENRTSTPAKAGAKCEREGDGELRFFPERYAKTFQQWHENLRDWCISRQLWWGHRIPVWTGSRAGASDLFKTVRPSDTAPDVQLTNINGQEFPFVGSESDPEVVHICAYSEGSWVEHLLRQRNFTQDPDVLDTWFSSGLWPLSTMGWPDPYAWPEMYESLTSRDRKGAEPSGGATDPLPHGRGSSSQSRRSLSEGAVTLIDTFNPSTVLCTAREIITLWVSRMVMFNRYFRDGKLPFRHVYIHAMIQDGHGQKMSKSLGNGVDPRDIIHSHGADAMRFTLAKLATATQDVRMPVDVVCPHCEHAFEPEMITTSAGHRVAAPELTCPSCKKRMVSGYGAASGQVKPAGDMPLARNTSRKFDEGRNFANKLWNAARFALANLREGESDVVRRGDAAARSENLVDRWMLARLARTARTIEDALSEYQFHQYAEQMYDLVWREFCDWYLEAIKPTVREDVNQQAVLHVALDSILRMLHPVMPFVTEAIWEQVSASARNRKRVAGVELEPNELCVTAAWPRFDDSIVDEQAIATFERLRGLIEAIRTIRGERNVPRKKRLRLAVGADVLALIENTIGADGIVRTLAGLDSIGPLPAQRPAGAVPIAFEGGEVLLLGVVDEADEGDIEAERARLTKFIEEKERAISGFQSRLSNPNYVSKAPPALVEETKQKLAEAEADREAARRALHSLEPAGT